MAVHRMTVPAPRPSRIASDALEERASRVLHLFARHGTVDVVLGAWGCGVFKNDPATVASIFKKQLHGPFKGYFRKVVFAVLDPSMARIFSTTLESESQPVRASTMPAGSSKGK